MLVALAVLAVSSSSSSSSSSSPSSLSLSTLEMFAILGTSGSGKTTLISILANLCMKNVTGDIYYNGNSYRSDFRRSIGYVDQIDEFLPSVNYKVLDHLTFIAELKLPSSMSRKARRKHVSQVIHQFGLFGCSNTSLSLVSGGERKRVSLAAELLVSPKLLLIDEGTSGLDSGAAMALMKMLRTIATDLRIPIIQSIHQPSSSIVNIFDKIAILSEGSLVYYGASADIEFYLSSIDYYLPSHSTSSSAVDFVLELLYSDNNTFIDGFYHRYCHHHHHHHYQYYYHHYYYHHY